MQKSAINAMMSPARWSGLISRDISFRYLLTRFVSSESELLETMRNPFVNDHPHEAISLFFARNVPNSQTFSTLFQACARLRLLDQGRALHHHMLAHFPNLQDIVVTNHLVNFYAKCGCLDIARQLLDQMPQRNVVSWTVLISGYDQHGRADDCFSLFSSMLAFHLPTEFAYASVLSSSDRDQGRQVHALALKTSFDAYLFVANALIMMYCKSCFYDHDNQNDDGWLVFETMTTRNLISWNSMITGFRLRGLGSRSLELFSQMHRDGIGYERATFVSVITSLCCDCGNATVDSVGLKCCFQLHCLVMKTGFVLEVEVLTALMKAYMNLGGELADCYRLFSETSGCRDLMSWTGIMAAYAENDPEKVFGLFSQLLQEGLHPDRYNLSVVIKACAELVTEQHGLVVHSMVVKGGFENDIVLSNALIHMYSRCGSLPLSWKIFNNIAVRDTVSCNSMLKAYALHGQAREALQLFSQMDSKPDAATFVAILSACSHAGLVDEGTEIFHTMLKNYGVAPELDHFACMVDILGRAGCLIQAANLINQMPMEPDYVVWSALLGACRKHGETEIAELSAMKLMEMVPENSLGYVMMSNIYCSKGSFIDAASIRKAMKGCRVRKEPGLSWIQIRNQVHEFAAGGRNHPQRISIYTKLDELIAQLKVLGYLPDTRLALHDVEEEHKEKQLHYHSEKLALAFALMNEDNLRHVGGVIKIMKNIRICVDCHDFMKLSSVIVQKEIVVRDANRFHHFKDRVCSCNDYW